MDRLKEKSAVISEIGEGKKMDKIQPVRDKKYIYILRKLETEVSLHLLNSSCRKSTNNTLDGGRAPDTVTWMGT